MGIDQIVKNVINNKALQEKLQKIAIEQGADVAFKLVKKGAKGSFDFAKTASNDIFKEKKEFNEKYDRLSKLVISSATDFKDYVNAVEEAENIHIYFKNEMKSVNLINPVNIVKGNDLLIQSTKWSKLKANLIKDVSKKMLRESHFVFQTKTESSFFRNYPGVNSDLLSFKTSAEVEKLISKLLNLHIIKEIPSSQYKDK